MSSEKIDIKGSEENLKKSIRLNHPCDFCKKVIYIQDGGLFEGKPMHHKCVREEMNQKWFDRIDEFWRMEEIWGKNASEDVKQHLKFWKDKQLKDLEGTK